MLTTRELVQAAISRSVEQLRAHESAVRSSDDPEALHQSRVATRRLRSDLRTFRPVLDPKWSEPLRDELRWWGQLLGNVRDADVLHALLNAKADDLPPGQHAVALRLVSRLRAERAADHASLLDGLRSDRYAALLERLVAATVEPAVQEGPGQRPARKVAPGLVRKPWRRLQRTVRALPSTPTDHELHEVRKRAKDTRYAAEAVEPAVSRPARRFAKRMEAVQSLLGTHQDLVVADMWLSDVVRDIDDADEVFLAGKLDAVINLEREAIRAEWARTWRAARRRDARRWF